MAHNTRARRAASTSATSLLVLSSLVLAFASALAAAQPVMQPWQVQLFTKWHSSVNTSSPHSDYYPRYNLLCTLAVKNWPWLSECMLCLYSPCETAGVRAAKACAHIARKQVPAVRAQAANGA